MAYVSHSGTGSTSQYDWKILIFMVLLLVSILVFVAVKFLFPEVAGGINTVSPVQATTTPIQVTTPVQTANNAPAAPISPTEVTSQMIPPERPAEKTAAVIAPAPKTTGSTTTNVLKSSAPQATHSAIPPVNEAPATINPELKKETGGLLCSESDRASGLCQ